ncbi:MAG: response regulator [Paracoccaceae bacterium]|nr:MAG: response regulator [Paracoccaceae bacterium]
MTGKHSDEGQTIEFQLDQVVRQCEAAYAARMKADRRSFRVMIAVGAERARLGDPFRLREMLDTLLASPLADAEEVTLSFSGRSGRPLVVEVSGVAPASARVRELVNQMGGRLETTGSGTQRIELDFDIVEGAEQHPAAAPATGDRPVFQALRLLIADDSPTNLMVIREMLANTGAEITAVSDGQQALEAWRKAPFDLLLLDIAMPVVDGLSALKAIRAEEDAQKRPHVPAVAVTANAMAHQVETYILGGFDTHIAKPFRRHELIDTIAALQPHG